MPVRSSLTKQNRIDVVQWIRSGAPLREGVSLYALLPHDARILKQVQEKPAQYAEEMIADICQLMGITRQKFNSIIKEHGKRQPEIKPEPAGSKPPKRKKGDNFRGDWSFLSRPECPTELKALAADKITCWQRYTEAHKKLFDCSSLDECYQVARDLVENYKENREIHEEFAHYQEHGAVLGKHRIWKHLKKYESLRGKNVIELVKLHEKTLPHRIWRIESVIKKGDKPHLQGERERRLFEVKAELAEVKRLLGING